jgi:16S rRNA (guanine527-N7)-methyltransferase
MEGEREPLPSRVEDTPPLPLGYHEALERGLAEFRGDGGSPEVVLAPGARDAIDGHMRLLLAWTTAINLTAIRDPVAAATGHVLDALAALPLLRSRGVERFLDLGSGGGVPGIPLAAALPAVDVLLVEPIGKKARFLATTVSATGLDRPGTGTRAGPNGAGRVRVAAARAETLAADPHHRGRWPAVTARAVASLPELIELALPLLAPHGILVAWKRGDLAGELTAGRRALDALGGGRLVDHPVELTGLAGYRLVVVERGGEVPLAYPRDPSTRKRRPW